MKEGKIKNQIIRAYKTTRSCKPCGFQAPFYGFDMDVAYIPLDCEKCSKVYWLVAGDPFFNAIGDRYRERPIIGGGADKVRYEAHEKFEETVDPCDCGGHLRVVNTKCPRCGSGDMEIDWKGANASTLTEFVVEPVTHTKTNIEEFKKRLEIEGL